MTQKQFEAESYKTNSSVLIPKGEPTVNALAFEYVFKNYSRLKHISNFSVGVILRWAVEKDAENFYDYIKSNLPVS